VNRGDYISAGQPWYYGVTLTLIYPFIDDDNAGTNTDFPAIALFEVVRIVIVDKKQGVAKGLRSRLEPI
jgi:hypothetical protein